MPVIKVTTALRLEEDAHIKITYIAKRKKRSLNAQLEYLVDRCIEEYEAKNGAIEIQEDQRGIK